jgi:hypothetical protein
MENAIKASTMAELLKLTPEAKRNLALALIGETAKEEKHLEQEWISEASNAALDLSLRIKRMRAVAECFADDYVDTCEGITCAMAVQHTEEHYESLFNAIMEIMVAVDKEAEQLQKNLDGIMKEI